MDMTKRYSLNEFCTALGLSGIRRIVFISRLIRYDLIEPGVMKTGLSTMRMVAILEELEKLEKLPRGVKMNSTGRRRSPWKE